MISKDVNGLFGNMERGSFQEGPLSPYLFLVLVKLWHLLFDKTVLLKVSQEKGMN